MSLVLAQRFHIVALDQRGHGDSEWPRDADTTRHSMADDAGQLIAALNLREPIICGHSMGGTVAMTLVTAQPGIARKVAFVRHWA